MDVQMVQKKSYIDIADESKEFFEKCIFEQNVAVEEVVYALYEKAKRVDKHGAKEVFLFCGAPSSGKRYLAEKMAQFDRSVTDFITIDMSRFVTPAGGEELYGMGIDEEGKVKRYGELYLLISEKPHSILLFDNIDKADPVVQSNLAKMLEEPESFNLILSDTVIIFTTVMGSELYQKSSFMEQFRNDPIKAKSWMLELLATKNVPKDGNGMREAFSGALLNLFMHHHVVPFMELSLKVLAQIGAVSIKSLTPYFSKKIGAPLKIKSPKIISTLLTLSGLPYINAKEVKNKIPESLFFEISRFVKEKKKIPALITVDIGGEAKKFYEKNKILIDAHVSDTQSQLKSARLIWKDEWSGSEMTMRLVNVEYRKNLNTKIHDFGQKPRIRFSETAFGDIAGQKQVKTALKEIIDLLGKTDLIDKFKIKPPRGILLFGPEGVGKTTLAQAFCKEADMPYIMVSTAELFNQAYIKHVYQIAKSHTPMVVILQGVDMQGYVEGMVTNVPAEPIMEMLESLSKYDTVFTIATATNEANVSSDLTKSGMIDIRVEVPELDKEARKFYIQQILKKPNDGKIDLDRVVRYISGMSRDELERLDREVALNAIKKNMNVITEELIIEQINIIKYGQKLDSMKVKNFEEELKMTAYHEAGHAVLSHILLPDIKIEQVTITPRSDALGFVSYSMEDYTSNVTKEELFNNVCVLLAGRIAKVKQFGEVKGLDSGAMNDLEQATTQVYLAITMLGMDEELGMISMGGLDNSILHIFGSKIEERIQDWLTRAKTKTELMVNQHWEQIETLAKKLIENEVVEGEELEAIIGKA